MQREEFRIVPLPDVLQTPEANCTSLTVWRESVALFFFPGTRRNPRSIEIWAVMNEGLDGVGGNYTVIKELVIEPLAIIACPVAFWKHDEIVMKSRKGKLVSYNICSRKLRNLSTHSVDRTSSSALFFFFFILCEEPSFCESKGRV